MNNIVKINDTDLQVIEHRSIRVVTLAQVDMVHARPEGTAGRNFREHKHRLVENEDYFIASSDEIRRNNPAALPGAARRSDVVLLSETGYLMLVKSFNDDMAWQVQRQLVNGYFAAKHTTADQSKSRARSLTRTQVAGAIMLLRSAAEDLKMAPSAVLGAYQRLEDQLGISTLLPGYAVDAPASADGGSSEVTKSATELLEQFEVDMSTVAFNRLLTQNGFLQEHERRSSKGVVKKFKACANMEFGKNVTNPQNPKETQPHWYVSKFAELLALVLPPKPKAVA